MDINPSTISVEVDQSNLQAVMEQSLQRPVLVDFYADWCEPCQQLGPVLDALAQSYQGRILLAKINADEHQLMASQMGVRGLPAMKLIFQGQIVGELVGNQPESAIRQMIDQVLQHIPDQGDGDQIGDFLAQIDGALHAGMAEEAAVALEQQRAVLEGDDKNRLTAKLAEVKMLQQDVAAVEALLAELPDDYPGRGPIEGQLAFLDELAELNPEDQIRGRLAEDETDVEAWYQLGVHGVGSGRWEEALQCFLRVMTLNRQYKEGAANRALIRVFDILGGDDPLVSQYRRKMFTLLH